MNPTILADFSLVRCLATPRFSEVLCFPFFNTTNVGTTRKDCKGKTTTTTPRRPLATTWVSWSVHVPMGPQGRFRQTTAEDQLAVATANKFDDDAFFSGTLVNRAWTLCLMNVSCGAFCHTVPSDLGDRSSCRSSPSGTYKNLILQVYL